MPHYPYMGIVQGDGGGFVQQITPQGWGIVTPSMGLISACALYHQVNSEMAGIDRKKEAEIIGSGDEDVVSSELSIIYASIKFYNMKCQKYISFSIWERA